MRLLHTSDWHVGRTFHSRSTLEHLGVVLDALVERVREERVDVVLVAGDVFDTTTPSADAYALLERALHGIRDAGARVVATSGNHDSAARLGFQSEWARHAGVHMLTRPEGVGRPVELADEHGPVRVYGIPFLEPVLVRHLALYEGVRTHEQALARAMETVRADLAARPARSVVLAHCFAAGVAASGEASDVERDITAGGLDVVSTDVLAGVEYAALGHIHGRSVLADGIRYSGAPLHYSFAEAGKPRGGWLIELDASGLGEVRWVPLPVPRALARLTGTLEELLTDARHAPHVDDWVDAVLTDTVRPLDAMRRLQERFPHAVALEHRPAGRAAADEGAYAERTRHADDAELVDEFLRHVRGGVGASEAETALVRELIDERRAAELSR